MRFDPTRRKYVVRWRDDGRKRTRRFDTPEEVEDVDEDRIGRSRGVVTSSTSSAAPRGRLDGGDEARSLTKPEELAAVGVRALDAGERWRSQHRGGGAAVAASTSNRAATSRTKRSRVPSKVLRVATLRASLIYLIASRS